jgi:hypothetical protein
MFICSLGDKYYGKLSQSQILEQSKLDGKVVESPTEAIWVEENGEKICTCICTHFVYIHIHDF